MANLSKIKRERMLEFLESLKAEHTDDKSIRAFTEISFEDWCEHYDSVEWCYKNGDKGSGFPPMTHERI